MKSIKLFYLFFVLTFFPVYGQNYQTLIPLKNITLSPIEAMSLPKPEIDITLMED